MGYTLELSGPEKSLIEHALDKLRNDVEGIDALITRIQDLPEGHAEGQTGNQISGVTAQAP
jgi:hypothetical protein